MRERPILFSGPMVQALLAGRKTVTRRVVKPAPVWHDEVPGRQAGGWSVQGRQKDVGLHAWADASAFAAQLVSHVGCPYGQPGDRLWVRETWSPDHRDVYPCPDFVYAADGTVTVADRREHIHACTDATRAKGERNFECLACVPFRWRPSIHMPRRVSRLTLEVVSVRVECLHDITEEDAKAEGIVQVADGGWGLAGAPVGCTSARWAFKYLWTSINGEESWDANPWVWVVSFKSVGAST